MSKILLNDLLNLSKEEIANTKVKFNKYNGSVEPIDEYLNNPEDVNSGWLLWRNERKYYSVGQIAICLVRLAYEDSDTWLLTTIKKITKDLNVKNGVSYEAEEMEEYSHYFGRVIVKFHKETRGTVFRYSTYGNDLEVLKTLSSPYDGINFPGYDKVCLQFPQLKLIVDRNRENWVTALSSQKAVYLIADKKTGKMYVGSATSENGMLLKRWSEYTENGHGGNKKLRKLISDKGIKYAEENFQFSILENYNEKIDDGKILERESWWKQILATMTTDVVYIYRH